MSTIRFELPVTSLIGLNKMLRMNHYQRSKLRTALAWEVMAAIGRQRPVLPIPHARLIMERHAPRSLDPDNLAASVKSLADVLQPLSKRHPSGLGVISSDAHDALDLVVRNIKCHKNGSRVIVVIEPIYTSLI